MSDQSTSDRIVVIGGSLAGISTVDALRLRGCSRPITLIGAEPHLPYDRPPLSKGFLAADKPGAPTPLREDSRLADLDIEVMTGVQATGIDVAGSVVHTTAGDVAFGDVVIATGSTPRPHPVPTDLAGFHPLRTLEDATAVRTALETARDVVVLGAGFIGAEVAVAARARGIGVTMVERLETPMSSALGSQVGALLQRMHTEHGVDVRCGVTIDAAHGESGRVTEVSLSDDSRVAADLVVVGLGVTPVTDWLAGSEIKVEDGVVCDERMRAVGHENVYAVGDVARWPHPLFGESLRIEHWTNATDHAEVVASQIVGTGKVADAVPYVWSDQYGHRIQIVGYPRFADHVEVLEDRAGHDHVVAYARDGVLIGLLTVNTPRAMVKGRRAIAGRTRLSDFLDAL